MTAASDTRTTMSASPWDGFRPGRWQTEIAVRDFIQLNYVPFEGDASFLATATPRTKAMWQGLEQRLFMERRKGVPDASMIPSSITSHEAGYIDRENEIIFGLQTEAPLKRSFTVNGG